MNPNFKRIFIHGGSTRPSSPSLHDFVMAWAVDATTGQPRYILELGREQTGLKCNCRCQSCNLPLTAVNAGKSAWKRRPHFRHPEGSAREGCIIVAARRAIEAMLGRRDRIVLPRRRRSREVEGLSGAYHDAWVERPAEPVRIADCAFNDEANAILTLDDGRKLHVRLVGRGEVAAGSRNEDRLVACIEIQADDPAVANMSPDEIIAHLELVWSEGCWTSHWEDGVLDAAADALARTKAVDALDWIDDGDLPGDLTPAERRETLLHREVKAILDRERRIRVPELRVEADWTRTNGLTDRRAWSKPSENLRLSSVALEAHLGCAVPDVMASWVAEEGGPQSMLIEVTVTNQITNERIERLSSLGWPVLEIDVSRMGGTVTRDELTRLVLDEVAGKRWLYHPAIVAARAKLVIAMQKEEAQAVAAQHERREAPPNKGDSAPGERTATPGQRGTRPRAVGTAFVDYDPFEFHPWAQDDDKSALLRAAGVAARQKLSPGAFARNLGRDDVLGLLMEAGLAKTRYEWSWEWDKQWVCPWNRGQRPTEKPPGLLRTEPSPRGSPPKAD